MTDLSALIPSSLVPGCSFHCEHFLKKFLKILRKKPKFEVAEKKCLFYLVYFVLKKFKNLISIWYCLEEKDLSYQVNIEN